MKSKKHGKNISTEILGITKNGLWLLANEKEYFLPFSEFPWFRSAAVSSIQNCQLSHSKYLQWPELDIDLDLDSLSKLDQYPLVAKSKKRRLVA